MPDETAPSMPTLTDTFNDAATALPPAQEQDGSGSAAGPHTAGEQPAQASQAAVVASTTLETTASTPSDAEEDARMLAMLEARRAKLNAEMHHRPDDKELVKEVHTGLEANREHTIKHLQQKGLSPNPDATPNGPSGPQHSGPAKPDPGPSPGF